MPHYIVKFETPKGPRYLDWSTVVDAPVTYGMTLEQFKAWYRQEHGDARTEHGDFGKGALAERIERVEAKGVSAIDYRSAEELISFNRAGPGESCLTKEQIVAKYCRD